MNELHKSIKYNKLHKQLIDTTLILSYNIYNYGALHRGDRFLQIYSARDRKRKGSQSNRAVALFVCAIC